MNPLLELALLAGDLLGGQGAAKVALRNQPPIPRRIPQQVCPVHGVLKNVIGAAFVNDVQVGRAAEIRFPLLLYSWAQWG